MEMPGVVAPPCPHSLWLLLPTGRHSDGTWGLFSTLVSRESLARDPDTGLWLP